MPLFVQMIDDIVYNAFLEGKLSVPNAIDPLYHLNQLSDSRDGPGCAPTGRRVLRAMDQNNTIFSESGYCV